MILPDRTYPGVIKDAMIPDVPIGDKPYLQVTIETPDGDIDHRLYLTVAAKDMTEKALLELGLPAEYLASPDFWVTPGQWIDGKTCSIKTVEETYNGKPSTRVKWLNGPHKAKMPAERARGLAGLFARPDYNAPAPPVAGGDDDLPF